MADVGVPRTKDQAEVNTSAPTTHDAPLGILPTPPTTPSEQLAYMSKFDVPTVAIDRTMYYSMTEVGVLDPQYSYELIYGTIIQSQPISPNHAHKLMILTEQLNDCLRKQAVINSQNPLSVNATSEVQPDIALLVPPAERYRDRHPTPEDVLLVIEIASSTLKTDRTLKLQLYASANIPEYWIVNLIDKQLEAYINPDLTRGQYLETKRYNVGDDASPKAFPDCQLRWWV
ncbi:MAG: Uma2 family endonuclease [Deinococcota bacterium]